MGQVIPNNIIKLSDKVLSIINKDINFIVDMTLGNGNDALKLLNYFPKASLTGFDIQEIAINNTRETLKDIPTSRYKLVLDSHENIGNYCNQIDLALYNLGYLPKADKTIVTKAESTINSLKSSLELLNINGIIIIIFYIGHEGGMEEYKLTKKFLGNIDQRKYNVLETNYLNQINNPPRLVCIERIR